MVVGLLELLCAADRKPSLDVDLMVDWRWPSAVQVGILHTETYAYIL